MFRIERGLKPLPNEFSVIIIKINLTTNYQLLLNCNKVHRAEPNRKRLDKREHESDSINKLFASLAKSTQTQLKEQ
jgi:pyruvate formate-lyase activating enzyme-like uncharacterized protein